MTFLVQLCIWASIHNEQARATESNGLDRALWLLISFTAKPENVIRNSKTRFKIPFQFLNKLLCQNGLQIVFQSW